jgi:hypothetical protein
MPRGTDTTREVRLNAFAKDGHALLTVQMGEEEGQDVYDPTSVLQDRCRRTDDLFVLVVLRRQGSCKIKSIHVTR